MKPPPFKMKGIYARIMNDEKELGIKQTKKENIWKVIVGDKIEANYDILCFYEEWDFDKPETKTFYANYSIRSGEIFHITDWYKNSVRNSEYGAVQFQGNSFEFHSKMASLSGYINDDILFFNISNKSDGNSYSQKFRYVPWL